MDSIFSTYSEVAFNAHGYLRLHEVLNKKNYSTLFIIVDQNTHEYCLSKFLSVIQTEKPIEIIEIQAGEEHKNIETCSGVWNALSELNADRKALIINLGGGVVTDLGGFVACTYKRGVDFINIPTSLLAMVDASIGGKTGVDLGFLKNQIGVINEPELVLIDTSFLSTLPQKELRSGLAEVYKHGLIANREYWNKLIDLSNLNIEDLDQLIYDSVIIKNTITQADPKEQGIRKTLNYGHTLGHAIESYFLSHPDKNRLLHGEAIAIGMIMEGALSRKQNFLPNKDLKQLSAVLFDMYDYIDFNQEDRNAIIELLKYDKKNSHGQINFVFLKEIGTAIFDQQVTNEAINEAFDYYQSLQL